MDFTTRMIALGISTAIAAGFMAWWREKKAKGVAIDRANGGTDNAARHRRIENRVFMCGAAICAFVVVTGYALVRSLPPEERKGIAIIKTKEGRSFILPAPKD